MYLDDEDWSRVWTRMVTMNPVLWIDWIQFGLLGGSSSQRKAWTENSPCLLSLVGCGTWGDGEF